MPAVEVSQPSITTEAVEVPSIVPPTVPSAESPVPPEVTLPAEPSVPEISGIEPSVESTEVPVTQSETPSLGLEIPQIPPAEVSSILGAAEEEAVPPTPAPPTEDPVIPPTTMPQMENIGYDQV